MFRRKNCPRILLAIRNLWLCITLQHILQDHFFKITIANTDDELLRLINRGNKFDLFVISPFQFADITPPIIQQIHHASPATPIIALLSQDNADYRSKVLSDGAQAIVIEEFAYEQLFSSINDLMKGREYGELIKKMLSKKKAILPKLNKEVAIMHNKFGKQPMSRRTFLKGTAVAGAAATLASAPAGKIVHSLEESTGDIAVAPSEEKMVHTVCRPNCGNACYIYAHVRDGRVVKTSMAPLPDPRHNRICLRGLSNVQQMYGDRRLKYPMKRVGERGEGKWERISWDEAIDTIVTKFQEIRDKYGSRAICFTQGSGNYGALSGSIGSAAHRFFSALEATALSITVDAALFYGQTKVLGEIGGNESSNLVNSKLIIASGANVTEATIHHWHWFAEAMENGTKVIAVDPMYTTFASKANQWIQIRPGTDAVLYLSMMQVIFEQGLEDLNFIHDHTVGPFLVRQDDGKFLRQSHVTGKEPEMVVNPATGQEVPNDPIMVWSVQDQEPVVLTEGIAAELSGTYEINGIKVTTALDLLKQAVAEYTPEHASEITTIPAETIRSLAVAYGTTKPAWLYSYLGLDHWDNGHYTGFAQATLSVITGNIGLPGASIGIPTLYYFPHTDWSYAFPDWKMAQTIYMDDLFSTATDGTVMGKPYPIKAMYVMCSNPLNCHADQNTWLNKVLPSMEFIVTADIYDNDTARYSDLVLPVAHWFEITDIYGGQNHPHVMYAEKAVEPSYESKGDLEIVRLLASRLGVGQYFDYSDDELLQMSMSKPFGEMTGCTLDKLKEQGAIKIWTHDPNDIGPGYQGIFKTPSGRAEFYNENPVPRVASTSSLAFNPETERLPSFKPPIEAWHESEVAKKYPLVYFQEHTRWRVHTQWATVPWLREMDPEPTVKMSPDDANPRGISQGDYVEIFNDRGHVVVKAVITNALPKGMLAIPKGWERYQTKVGSQCELTHMKFNPASINQSFFDVAVDVRKWNGEV